MYKDKPYNYPSSRRRGRKRIYLAIGLVVALAWLYYSGWIGRSRDETETRDGKGLWSTFSSDSRKGPVNWTQRREQVKKAMEISWAGYEKYAWGMLLSMAIYG
jgi:mannosyl-oligosaccharide alpha-1,2-mannosidase